jgi:hypothetical protein
MWKYQGEQSGILSMSHLWCNASPTPFEGKVLEVYRAAFIVAFLLHHLQVQKMYHFIYGAALTLHHSQVLKMVQCFIYTICRSWRCTSACKSTQFTGTEMHWSACSALQHMHLHRDWRCTVLLVVQCLSYIICRYRKCACAAALHLHHSQELKM